MLKTSGSKDIMKIDFFMITLSKYKVILSEFVCIWFTNKIKV